MKYLSLANYLDFKCIGSDCPLTCCSGWSISIDAASDEYYKSITGDFGTELNSCICRNDNDSSFIMKKNGDCPFLNNDHLCDIYINLGEEHMSQTCQLFPRTNFIAGNIVFSAVSVSCPEVSRQLLTRQSALLVDYSEDNDDYSPPTDWNQFNQAIRVFSCCINILQDRTINIKERIVSVVLLCNEFQSRTYQNQSIDDLINYFTQDTEARLLAKEALSYSPDVNCKIDFIGITMSLGYHNNQLPEIQELINYFSTYSISVDEWMKASNAVDHISFANEHEQIIVYSFFRYFMQGFPSLQFWEQLSFSILGIFEQYRYILILYFIVYHEIPDLNYRILLLSHLSRFIDQSSSTKAAFLDALNTKGMLELENILRLVS